MFFGVIRTQISQKEFESKKETTVEFYGKLPFKIKTSVVVINELNNKEHMKNNKIKLYLARGGSDPSFKEMEIYYNDVPYPFSTRKLSKLLFIHGKHQINICRSLICGKTNIGKSTIGRFLSTKLDASLCL